MSNFDKSIDFVLDSEGYQGYAEQGDSGGWTCWGIDEVSNPNEVAQLKQIIANGGTNIDKIKADTKSYAATVYKSKYWDMWIPVFQMDLDSLDDWKMALALFDTGVNLGVTASFNLYQITSGSFEEFLLQRVAKYADIANGNVTDRQFFLGWINRVVNLLRLPR